MRKAVAAVLAAAREEAERPPGVLRQVGPQGPHQLALQVDRRLGRQVKRDRQTRDLRAPVPPVSAAFRAAQPTLAG